MCEECKRFLSEQYLPDVSIGLFCFFCFFKVKISFLLVLLSVLEGRPVHGDVPVLYMLMTIPTVFNKTP